MDGYGDAVTELKGICTAVADLNARLEDRNRTAAVPFCGNHSSFVLFALFPLAVPNVAVAEGLSKLSTRGGWMERHRRACLVFAR